MASIRKRFKKSRKGGKPVATWMVLYDDPTTGRQKSYGTFSTETKAKTEKAKLEIALASGTFEQSSQSPAAPVIPTLAEMAATWQSTRRVSAARTVADASLTRRFGPLLEASIDAKTRSDIRVFVADLVDEGLSAETVSAILRTLRSVYEQAVEDGHIASNPAARVKPPRIVRPPLDADDVYTSTELASLVRRTPIETRALMAVLAYLGARWSEGAALQRRDVDLARGRLHLGHRVVEEVSGKTRLRDGGKTRSADRVVPLPQVVALELSEHIARTQPEPTDLLFSTSSGGPISRTNFVKRIYAKTVAAAVEAGEVVDRNIPMRNLRHSAISTMLQARMLPLEVARIAGHSRPSLVLDVYGRFVPSDDRPSTEALDRFIADSVSRKCQPESGSSA